jgi:hypothetical protein
MRRLGNGTNSAVTPFDKEKAHPSPSAHRKHILVVGTVGFLCGWVLHAVSSSVSSSKYPVQSPNQKGGVSEMNRDCQQPKGGKSQNQINTTSFSSSSNNAALLDSLLAKRPNWRTDYNLQDWLPRWIAAKDIEAWHSWNDDAVLQEQLYGTANEKLREQAFWKIASADFTYGAANIGLGHRLAQLSYSYVCNVVPNQKQQLVHWDAPGLGGDNRAWHYLFQDSPALMGVPAHWKEGPWGKLRDGLDALKLINHYRNHTLGVMGDLGKEGIFKNTDCAHGDFNVYYRFDCGRGAHCQGYRHPTDLWLLRFAREPSAQEFYALVRAQLQQHVKDKVAQFIEQYFPPDMLVIGVHVRAGNGKDDGMGHFDQVHRGDWLQDLPAAITMVRKHIRMIAYSILDKYNMGGYLFNNDDYDAAIDDKYRIFLATDATTVLEEFQRQDSTVLSVPQDRVGLGDGVPIFQTVSCGRKSDSVDCAMRTQEAMLLDMLIISSCDASLTESYSNFMYTMPATLMMAEGRIFCESGRAALGGQYIFNEQKDRANFLGEAGWWVHPPPNTMPVRCYQGAWAARDRSNLNVVKDVGTR